MAKMQEMQNDIAKHVSLQDLGLDNAAKKLVSERGFSMVVRALLQNWRQGTVACKERCDVVSRSNKKPWKQKGTGRARAGSPRSPIWRGGGVSFGPHARTRTLSVPAQLKRNVCNNLLFDFIENNRVVRLNWQLDGDKPQTSEFYGVLKSVALTGKKIVLFVAVDDVLTRASCINIPGIKLLSFDQSNAYDLADSDYWVFMQKDTDLFKEMVARWI
jgi:large subunit ribosomal protein L4